MVGRNTYKHPAFDKELPISKKTSFKLYRNAIKLALRPAHNEEFHAWFY